MRHHCAPGHHGHHGCHRNRGLYQLDRSGMWCHGDSPGMWCHGDSPGMWCHGRHVSPTGNFHDCYQQERYSPDMWCHGRHVSPTGNFHDCYQQERDYRFPPVRGQPQEYATAAEMPGTEIPVQQQQQQQPPPPPQQQQQQQVAETVEKAQSRVEQVVAGSTTSAVPDSTVPAAKSG